MVCLALVKNAQSPLGLFISLSLQKTLRGLSVTRLGNLLEFGQLFKAFGKKSNKLLNIPCSMIDECYDSDVTFLRKTEIFN